MNHRRYKYHLWNSDWYKKNITESRAAWEKMIANDSGQGNNKTTGHKSKKMTMQDFFPWWRVQR